MARSRNIKPGFFKNEDLAECSVWARLLFPGLWMLADREGRLEDRPKRIKGELFPFDSVEVDQLLNELSQWGFVHRYLADGKKCIQINNFVRHQAPHGTERDSEMPDENGFYTVNERAKNGCITGKFIKTRSISQEKPDGTTVEPATQPLVNGATTVNQTLDNSSETVNPPLEHVNPPSDNALNPESLNPESNTSLSTSPPAKPTPPQVLPTELPEPSLLTAEQPNSEPQPTYPVVPDCPIDAILDAWAKQCPTLPQPRRNLFRQGKDAIALRQRWRWVLTSCHEDGPKAGLPLATSSPEGVAWFGKFFGYVSRSDFLTGHGHGTRTFLATVGWLVNKSNFEKVMQGNYENRTEETVA